MTDSLDRLSTLAEAATDGPWVFATDKGAPQYVQLYSASEEIDEYEADVLSASDGADLLISEADAEFIAAARSALPALVAVARAAEEVSDANFRRLEASLRKSGWAEQANKVQELRKVLEDLVQLAALRHSVEGEE